MEVLVPPEVRSTPWTEVTRGRRTVDLSPGTAVTAATATRRCSARDRHLEIVGRLRDTGRGWTGLDMREIQVKETLNIKFK